MTTFWRKLIAGSDRGVSRIHDQHGVRVRFDRLLRNGPRALATGLGRLVFGWRPRRPWISYDAAHVLAVRLNAGSRVLEFGAGQSTAWFAARAAEVVAIECDPAWYATIAARHSRDGCETIHLRLAQDPASYSTLTPAEAGDGFDLVLIDGNWRDLCVATAAAAVRPGGAIYLDNADRVGRPGQRRTATARALLLAVAEERGATVETFTDFAPAQLFVQTGLLVTLPPV